MPCLYGKIRARKQSVKKRIKTGQKMESTSFWNPESSTRNPESTAWNPESKTVLDFLTWGEKELRYKSVTRLRKLGTRCLSTHGVTQSEHLLEGLSKVTSGLSRLSSSPVWSGQRCFRFGYCPVQGEKNSDVNVLAIKTLNLIMLSTKTFERLVAFIHVVAFLRPVRRYRLSTESVAHSSGFFSTGIFF